VTIALPRSTGYLEDARTVLARGTGSSARLRKLSPTPVLASGEGARCADIDGNTYLDYVLALGPLFLGHRPRPVLDAVRAVLGSDDILCGGPHPREAELARLIVEIVPGAERVVLSTTGSEAVQVAIRIARARTGRRTVLKFDGHYHGWIEPVNVNALGGAPVAGDPPLALVAPIAEVGVPGEVLVCPWNDLAALRTMLDRFGDEIACVLMEPVPCNFGTFLPAPGYLEGARELCRAHGALLIFDEVVTGFRLALGGAQELLGVEPDLAVFAKAIASGFAIAAVAGTADAMAPTTDGPVQPGGTFNGATIGVVAAVATLQHLRAGRGVLYPRVAALAGRLADGIGAAAAAASLPLHASRVGGVVQLLWRPRLPMRNYADARTCDQAPVAMLAALVLESGILVHERGLMFLSAAHTEADIDETLVAFRRAIDALATSLADGAAG
jgi:glutamate-1-semialdehyde 2,1-aminomutase